MAGSSDVVLTMVTSTISGVVVWLLTHGRENPFTRRRLTGRVGDDSPTAPSLTESVPDPLTARGPAGQRTRAKLALIGAVAATAGVSLVLSVVLLPWGFIGLGEHGFPLTEGEYGLAWVLLEVFAMFLVWCALTLTSAQGLRRARIGRAVALIAAIVIIVQIPRIIDANAFDIEFTGANGIGKIGVGLLVAVAACAIMALSFSIAVSVWRGRPTESPH